MKDRKTEKDKKDRKTGNLKVFSNLVPCFFF